MLSFPTTELNRKSFQWEKMVHFNNFGHKSDQKLMKKKKQNFINISQAKTISTLLIAGHANHTLIITKRSNLENCNIL